MSIPSFCWFAARARRIYPWFKGPKKKRKRKTRKLKRKIKQGKVKARMRVQVTFTDEAGNTATEKRVARVKVRKRRR